MCFLIALLEGLLPDIIPEQNLRGLHVSTQSIGGNCSTKARPQNSPQETMCHIPLPCKRGNKKKQLLN